MNETPMNSGSGSSGSLVGSIIVVIILIIGAIYLFSSKSSAPVVPTDNAATDGTTPALNAPAPVAPAAIDGQSLEAEADLAATSATELDKDLKALDTSAGL